MLENLSDKLTSVFDSLKGKGRLTEEDIELAVREIPKKKRKKIIINDKYQESICKYHASLCGCTLVCNSY